MSEQPVNPEITQDDKLWAALGYPIPFLAILGLLMEEKKNRPFVRYHAIQSIAIWVPIIILMVILSLTVILALLSGLLWLVTLWPAYEAFQGHYLVLPYVTDFLKKQGWIK